MDVRSRVWPGLDVARRVFHAVLGEALEAQQAGVAAAARAAFAVGVVAARRQAVIDAQPQAGADNLGLGEAQQRRVDRQARAALNARLRREVGHLLERLDVFRAAIRIATVIYRIYPN